MFNDLQSQNTQNNDNMFLSVLGYGFIIIAGIFLILSFLPAVVLAFIIMFVIAKSEKKHWLNYAVIASVIILALMFYLGTWRDLIQFVSIPLSILNIKEVSTFLEDNLNQGNTFSVNLNTYLYTLFFSILIARVFYHLYMRFQSRVVSSKKQQDEESKASIKYQKVANNWQKINKSEQKKWRKKQKNKNTINDVLLGIDQGGDKVNVTYDELKQHVLATGTTGSGKTTALYSMLETALINKNGFVMIDGKGDPETIKQVQSLFKAYNRKLHVFHSSNNLTYNPFNNAGYTAATNLLFNELDWSEQFYKNATKEHTQNVIAFLDDFGYTRDLKNISKYLELKNLLDVLLADGVTHERTEIKKIKKQSTK